MGALAVASNGPSSTDQQPNYNAEYEKILKLRDEIVADKHPRLKFSKQIPSTASSSLPVVPRTNGISKPSTVLRTSPAQNGVSAISSQTASAKHAPQKPSNILPVSDFDPVLLTKGPALVREEMSRKRRAIEQSLRDQVQQKKRFSRQRLLDDEALPDFNVTQVLERAHDIVKPVRFAEAKTANRPASAVSSFDENDYYSSQVNSWTTTEPDADRSPKRHASSKVDEGSGAQPMDIDSVDADAQANAQPQPTTVPVTDKKDEAAAQAARIAELEEMLRLATEKNVAPNRVQTPQQEEGLIEEPEYSPPDVQQPSAALQAQNDISRRDVGQKEPAPRRSSRPLQAQSSEYATRNEPAPSPVQNDMRIVRNHITSPVAPQPARVSPLAVAKAPPVPQVRQPQQNERRNAPATAPQKPRGARASPDQPAPPLNPRKRRRGKNSGENGRNVAPRRENNSPEIRIKEEPSSPQLRTTTLEAWRPPRTEEIRRPVYVDNISPQQRASDATRRGERLAQIQTSETGRPFSPVERRNINRNGQLIEIHDEPDLRKIATTKQASLPQNEVCACDLTLMQIYMPPPVPESSRPFQASVQPQPSPRYYSEHVISPASRAPSRHGSIVMAPPQPRIVVDQYGNRFVEAPAPPERHMSIVPIARAEDRENHFEQPRPPPAIRNHSYEVGHDGRHYIQRAPSPTSPRYVQRDPSPVSPRYVRPVNERDNERYIEEPYVRRNDTVRVVSHSDSVPQYERFPQSREPIIRLQSVRPMTHYETPRAPSARPVQEPVSSMRPVPISYDPPRMQSIQPEHDRVGGIRPMTSQYEIPREQFTRVQSVRPEQNRIISLGGGREVIQRQVSVRPEEVFMRPQAPPLDNRPGYSYVPEVQERRYVEDDVFNDRVIYETPGSGRRIMQ